MLTLITILTYQVDIYLAQKNVGGPVLSCPEGPQFARSVGTLYCSDGRIEVPLILFMFTRNT